MPDWTKPMQQYYEYYEVDPNTWKDKRKINNVVSSKISRDTSASTLGSATIDITESLGECYIRKYLITVQNGITERHVLDTVLVETPSTSFNGKVKNISMDAYTPLIELKENRPPLGYHIPKGGNIMDMAYKLVREHVRAPVVKASSSAKLEFDFVADINDTWLSFITALIANADFTFELDANGRIMFAPIQETASLRPVWTYTDDDNSILYHDITMSQDLYGIPNIVEVICSQGGKSYYAKAVNNDKNSPTSVINRGREIVHRITSPPVLGVTTKEQVQDYAKRVLSAMSTLEYTISYTHGYCPVRPNDCVLINYSRAGLNNIKAKVISQDISCRPGCPVNETAVFTVKLWR